VKPASESVQTFQRGRTLWNLRHRAALPAGDFDLGLEGFNATLEEPDFVLYLPAPLPLALSL
jgi:hypothetical protein